MISIDKLKAEKKNIGKWRVKLFFLMVGCEKKLPR